MAQVDQNLISFIPKATDIETNNKYLINWTKHYSFTDIKKELMILSSRGKSKPPLRDINPVSRIFLIKSSGYSFIIDFGWNSLNLPFIIVFSQVSIITSQLGLY
jgi:hypothetical protein